jgi:hypothetical protein
VPAHAVAWSEARLAAALTERCQTFLQPLLEELDVYLDRRLVRTAAATVTALVRHRDRPQALLLSELGAYLAGPQHAPAGTKRLANLVHSPRWSAEVVAAHLLARAQTFVTLQAAADPDGRVLCILDGSVVEKPESEQAEGLWPVRSSKARRLARPRPRQRGGYWHGRPGGVIAVPGFHWQAVLLAGWAAPTARRPLALGAWQWSTWPTLRVEAERAALQPVVATCGAERLLHVWDRGLASGGWLAEALDQAWHFVVRWPKRSRLRAGHVPLAGGEHTTSGLPPAEGVAAWRLTAGLRAWGQREVANPRTPHQPLVVQFAARPVRLLHRDAPLWLVVARLRSPRRRRHGTKEPWRLLTTEPIETAQQCWRIVEAYAARWAVEQLLRFNKSELGIESVRVRAWESRGKLLSLVSLAYAFLLDLLGDGTAPLVSAVLHWAHRTGRQARDAWRSLYRLRLGLAALWNAHTPNLKAGP